MVTRYRSTQLSSAPHSPRTAAALRTGGDIAADRTGPAAGADPACAAGRSFEVLTAATAEVRQAYVKIKIRLMFRHLV